MAIKTRTEMIQVKDTVSLTAVFRDQTGAPADTDSFPTISIVQPDGLVALMPTSNGVMRVSTGKYQYDFAIGIVGPLGIWQDNWSAAINGVGLSASFNFGVFGTDVPGLNTDGYMHLGDTVQFDFSQTEIFNINKLIRGLRSRLNSRGMSKRKDAVGNDIFETCDIFSVEQLVDFLCMSLSWFNEVPHFTYFDWNDSQFVSQFYYILIQGAAIIALASRALIERGGEYSITDNSVNFTPPTISELMTTQWNTEITNHTERLKFIKNSMKPFAIGLSGYNTYGATNPAYRQLKMRRQRQIF